MIKRQVFDELKDHLDKKEITLIVGPRQAGKTTLMMLLKDHVEAQGKRTIFLEDGVWICITRKAHRAVAIHIIHAVPNTIWCAVIARAHYTSGNSFYVRTRAGRTGIVITRIVRILASIYTCIASGSVRCANASIC